MSCAGLRQAGTLQRVKKNTPYAAQISAEKTAKEAYDMGLRRLTLLLKDRVQAGKLL